MNSAEVVDLVIFVLIILIGIGLIEAVTSRIRRIKRFSLFRYCLLLLPGVIATTFAYIKVGVPVIYMFAALGVVGVAFEYFTGHAYTHIVGTRLWRYYRNNIGGNTSWLTMPMWGFAGVLFLLLSRVVS